MDIFGNFGLGCWFMFLTVVCYMMAHLVMRDMIPAKCHRFPYLVWKSVGYALYAFTLVVFCVAAQNLYLAHHHLLLWIRS